MAHGRRIQRFSVLKISRAEVFSKQERSIRSQTRCYHRTDRQSLACWTTNRGDTIEAICQSPQFLSFTFWPPTENNPPPESQPQSYFNSVPRRPITLCDRTFHGRDVTQPNHCIRPLLLFLWCCDITLASLAGSLWCQFGAEMLLDKSLCL